MSAQHGVRESSGKRKPNVRGIPPPPRSPFGQAWVVGWGEATLRKELIRVFELVEKPGLVAGWRRLCLVFATHAPRPTGGDGGMGAHDPLCERKAKK